jgi:quercetin dioxygenase-like cupin family protein
MSRWIKKSLSGFEQRSPADPDSHARPRFGRDPLASRDADVSLLSFEPNELVALGDAHREQLEVFVVLAGSGRARLDDEVIELASWDVVRVTGGVRRAFEGGPDGMRLLCLGGRDARVPPLSA